MGRRHLAITRNDDEDRRNVDDTAQRALNISLFRNKKCEINLHSKTKSIEIGFVLELY